MPGSRPARRNCGARSWPRLRPRSRRRRSQTAARTPWRPTSPCHSGTALRSQPPCIHGLVGLKVVDGAAGAPGPRAQRAPFIHSLRGWPLLVRPMTPAVKPSPLSAWMLVGIRTAYPQPRARSWLRQSGPVPWKVAHCSAVKRFFRAAIASALKPNSIMMGTGPWAFAGVTRVSWMLTSMAGYAELSRCPVISFLVTGTSPTCSCTSDATCQATAGTFLGTRP